MIQKAMINDHHHIMNIIRDAIADLQSHGIDQWDALYPNAAIIEQDLAEGTLYVCKDEQRIKGLIVFNEYQEQAYESLVWQYPSGKHLIIHRLCIDPQYQGQGIARMLLEYAEEYGKEAHYQSIRLDAFIPNQRACKLYKNAGYRVVGVVTFQKGDFYCYEKDLL